MGIVGATGKGHLTNVETVIKRGFLEEVALGLVSHDRSGDRSLQDKGIC